jgi:hypothetical protein
MRYVTYHVRTIFCPTFLLSRLTPYLFKTAEDHQCEVWCNRLPTFDFRLSPWNKCFFGWRDFAWCARWISRQCFGSHCGPCLHWSWVTMWITKGVGCIGKFALHTMQKLQNQKTTGCILFAYSAEFVRFVIENGKAEGIVYQLFMDFKKVHDSVRRDVLYNILTEFCVPIKLCRLVIISLHETCSKNLNRLIFVYTFLFRMVWNEMLYCIQHCFTYAMWQNV